MGAAGGGGGRVWLDVTTTRQAGGHYDGTTRIERSLIRELPACLGTRLSFSPTTGRSGTSPRCRDRRCPKRTPHIVRARKSGARA